MQLAGKAEASRVQQLEEQVDEQLNVMCAMRSKQELLGVAEVCSEFLGEAMCWKHVEECGGDSGGDDEG
eukprot:scaffold96095_cov20-Tisochrysis_lutea.AAC.2